MSRPHFSLFSLFLCHNLKISVATSKHLFILKYGATLTLLVATRVVHPLSTLCRDLVFLLRPKLLLQHLFCLNKLFHVTKSVLRQTRVLSRQIFCLQFSIMSQHKLSCSQLTCICFSHSLLRPSSIVNNQIMVLRHMKCCCDTVAWKFFETQISVAT